MADRTYTEEEQEIGEDWFHEWALFIGLLSRTIISDEPPYSPPDPYR